MNRYLAPAALLPEGWARRVLLEVDAHGCLGRVEPDCPPAQAEGAEVLAGPVLPGLANLHSHAFQRALAGLAQRAERRDESFWSWRERMYALVAHLSPEDIQTLARRVYIELLKAGWTAVAEFHYLHRDARGRAYADPAELALRIVAAARETGIGLTLLPALYRLGGFGERPVAGAQKRFAIGVDDFLHLLERVREHGAREGFVTGTALHSLRAVAAADMRTVLQTLPRASVIHIHIAEQRREVDECLAWSGRRPLDWLFAHAPVDARWCLVHATHVDATELARLAGSHAVAGLCPSTEADLGDGLFPATEYGALNGSFGIGTDSHVRVDPAGELRLLEWGQRLRLERRACLASPGQPSVGGFLLRRALAGGAQACGQPTGALAPGRRADWVVLDGAQPLLAGAHGDAITERWIFGGDSRFVRDVMVGGRWCVREGHHPLEAQADAAFASVIARVTA
ncbi:formimidoylglutamate deiminase [Plasticicumulans sp.]|uniref:formimidoylglutamate deiminase n=1 Tax=Plasticicumulans sp. TaxID=2307179 RepID=UPI00321FF166